MFIMQIFVKDASMLKLQTVYFITYHIFKGQIWRKSKNMSDCQGFAGEEVFIMWAHF